ncbi:hypothetical protein HN51_014294 [Arachis hypogaea]
MGVMSCLCTQNCLQESLGHHIRHIRRLKRNLNILKSLLKELDTQKVDMWAKLNQKVASKRDEFKERCWRVRFLT